MALIIGFHDWQASAQSGSVTAFVDRLISGLELQLPDVSLSAKGRKGHARAGGSVAEILSGLAQDSEFSLTLYNERLQDEFHIMRLTDHYIELDAAPRDKTFFLYCKTSNLAALQAAVAPAFAGWSAFRGGYGYALDWQAQEDSTPMGFVSGEVHVPEGLSDEAFDRALSEDNPLDRWREALWSGKKPYLQGLFRDVYPLNFVTGAHLDNRIGSRSLLEHIRTSPLVLGSITPLDEGFYLWQVPESELDEVRAFLDGAGLLLAPERLGTVG